LREADLKTELKKIEERVSRIFYSLSATKDSADKSSDVVNGKAISLPVPQVPNIARTIKKSGSVRVRILIDESGNVLKACAIDGPVIFRDVSKTAALSAHFTPTVKDGKPVKVIGFVTYNFRSGF
jgi:protein TonB